MDVKIEQSWKEALKQEFEKPYFAEIITLLKAEKALGRRIYPPGQLIFHAFEKTPYHKCKVVLLGQDPYHNPGQAHGLSFSVPKGVTVPPSLVNIYKELKNDLGLPIPSHGNLESWAEQGVLLLNSILTVKENDPGSHSRIGWMRFTDSVIQKLSDENQGLVFLLWGKFAQEKQVLIDATKHHILKAAHPSPLSAHNGFFGCKHFSKTNYFLQQEGRDPIDWKVI